MELQTELDLGWSDFGVRCLDNWSGKWLGVDIMAEVKPNISPYAYGLGNPIRYSDPSGMIEEDGSVSTSLWGRDVTGGENSGEVLNSNFLSAGQLSRDLTNVSGGGLTIPSNDNQAKKDLRSMLPKGKKYDILNFNNDTGAVSMDVSGLSKKAISKAGQGFDLLNNMINGDDTFFYATNMTELKIPRADGGIATTNLLSFPDATFPRKNTKYPGYDGAAFVNEGVVVYSHDGTNEYKERRESIVFHALMESYVLTKMKVPSYKVAHQKANQFSTSFYRNIGDGNVTGYKIYNNGVLYTHAGPDPKTGQPRTFVRKGKKVN